MAMIKLVGLEGPMRGKSRMLHEGEYVISRDAQGRNGYEITIPDPKVSSPHAKLNVTSTNVTIEDMDSLNGTYVNDSRKANRIVFEMLNDQDTFSLGPSSMFGIRFFEFRAAGFWKRVLAVIIDNLALAPVAFGGGFLIGLFIALLYRGDPERAEAAGFVFYVLGWIWGAFLSALYFTIMHGWRGQTLGKMALGLKVVRNDGRNISYGTAFLRYLMWTLLAPLSLGIFYIFLAVHPQKRGWHDLIADTRVIQMERN